VILFASVFATTVSILVWAALVFLDHRHVAAVPLAIAAASIQIVGVRTMGEYVRARQAEEQRPRS